MGQLVPSSRRSPSFALLWRLPHSSGAPKTNNLRTSKWLHGRRTERQATPIEHAGSRLVVQRLPIPACSWITGYSRGPRLAPSSVRVADHDPAGSAFGLHVALLGS